MEIYWLIIALVTGTLIGAGIVWLINSPHITTLNQHFAATQQELASARSDVNQKNERIFELNQSLARLETTLEHERKASIEKITLLNQTSQKLQDTFKALSSEALRSNNQSFLELAKTTLEKYQTEAKGDLEQRQKAVETM